MLKQVFIVPVGEGTCKSLPHYPHIGDLIVTFEEILSRLLMTWVMERGELTKEVAVNELGEYVLSDLDEAMSAGYLSEGGVTDEWVDQLLENNAAVTHYLYTDLKPLFDVVAPAIRAGYEVYAAHILDSNDHDLYVEVTFRTGDKNAKADFKRLIHTAHR